jgi:hypothetical protein
MAIITNHEARLISLPDGTNLLPGDNEVGDDVAALAREHGAVQQLVDAGWLSLPESTAPAPAPKASKKPKPVVVDEDPPTA